ncbi:hypothetical protein C0995_003561 [Termitomyces sp. Mi166|nr:hypothetical protein C0995_003561 [Termitomyces sp. Mi166\
MHMVGALQYVPRILRTANSVVYLEYHPQRLCAVPGPEWTRFVCISDTHARTFDVPDGDVLLHSGDLTHLGLLKEFEEVMEWLYELPHKAKIRNQEVDRGWSPWFHNWAFNYNREDGEALVSKFPATDILLTHGPPARILDRTQSLDFTGCADLRNHLPRLRPRLHVFGHIHESRGAYVHAWGPEGNHELTEVKVIDDEDEDEDEDDDMEDLDIRVDGEDEVFGGDGEVLEDEDVCHDGDGTQRSPETVFVNAATSPAGKGTWRAGQRILVGGPGFQAVVVDLRD